MAYKLTQGPAVIRAASLTLTGTLANVVGTVSADNANATSGAVAIGALATLVLRVPYTRHGSSTTGRPIVRVYGSLDAEGTAAASVSNWQGVMLLDGSSFSSGAVELYPEQMKLNPSATGATVFSSHFINVSPFNWILVQLADVDGVNPGAVANLAYGGSS